jgi:hypothetical protein
MATDDQSRLELEAAVYRRLVEHLRSRTDVQNIDLMNLAGFCRNCLSNWMKEAADKQGVALTKEQSRERVYGCLTTNGALSIKKTLPPNKKRRSKKQAKSIERRVMRRSTCVVLWMKREVLDQSHRAFEWSA